MPKPDNKNTIIVIIVVLLALCVSSCMSSLGGGGYYYSTTKEKKKEKEEEKLPQFYQFNDIEGTNEQGDLKKHTNITTSEQKNVIMVDCFQNNDCTNVVINKDKIYENKSNATEFKDSVGSILYVKSSNTDMLDALKNAGKTKIKNVSFVG